MLINVVYVHEFMMREHMPSRVYALPEKNIYTNNRFKTTLYIYTSVLLCIYMHRESASDSEVDPIVKLIWSKVCITIYITISITSLITIVA